jgi:hypothetical protein
MALHQELLELEKLTKSEYWVFIKDLETLINQCLSSDIFLIYFDLLETIDEKDIDKNFLKSIVFTDNLKLFFKICSLVTDNPWNLFFLKECTFENKYTDNFEEALEALESLDCNESDEIFCIYLLK